MEAQNTDNVRNATIYVTAGMLSLDPTITVPNEVHVYADGHAVACHADSGDVEYPTIISLEYAYGIDLSDAPVSEPGWTIRA